MSKQETYKNGNHYTEGSRMLTVVYMQLKISYLEVYFTEDLNID